MKKNFTIKITVLALMAWTSQAVFAANEPASAAPAAETTYPANQVMAIFSDVYDLVANVNCNPRWGQNTTVSRVDIVEDETLKYVNLSFQGTTFNELDASSMEYLHIDIFAPATGTLDLTAICKVKGVTNGKTEEPVTLNLTGGQWNSIDVPITDWTSQGSDFSALYQFKINNSAENPGIWIDNWYLYKTDEISTSTSDISVEMKLYPNPVAENLSVEADCVIEQVTVSNLLGQELKSIQAGAQKINVSLQDMAQGNYFVTIQTQNGKQVTRKIVKQ